MNRRTLRNIWLWSAVLILGCGQMACVSDKAEFKDALAEGNAEYDRENYAEALGMYEHAEEIDPERPEPSYLIGKCYLAMADRQFSEDDLPGALRYCDRAIATFEKALAGFPGYSRAVQGKADALKLRGKHQAAYDIARWVATQSAFQSKKLIVEARQYSMAGDLDNAELSLIKAVAVAPDEAAAHAEIGRFYVRIGNRDKAVEHLRRAYAINPGAPGVFKALLDLGAAPRYPN